MTARGPIKDNSGYVTARVVAVAPVATTLWGPVVVRNLKGVAVTLANDDGAQTLAAFIEVGPSETGPWYQSPWAAFESLAAGASVSDVAATEGYGYARMRGTASGAGLSARVWAVAVEWDT